MQVGGREAERAPALLAVHDATAQRDTVARAARARARTSPAAISARAARVLLTWSRRRVDRTDDVDREAVPRAERRAASRPCRRASRPKFTLCPTTTCAQLEVAAAGSRATNASGSSAAKRGVKRCSDRDVDAEVAEQRQPIVQRLEHRRAPASGASTATGCGWKVSTTTCPPQRRASATRAAHDRLVSEVHAVEVAERQHDAAERRR